jgi:hypothetical protein
MAIYDLAGCASGAVQPLKEVQSKYDGRQAVLNDRVFLAFPKTAEQQNRCSDSGIPELDSLFGHRNAKPADAGSFEGA